MTEEPRAGEPALTKAQWDAFVFHRATRSHDERWEAEYAAQTEDELHSHARAALFLYAQNYGFSWADVDMLRAVEEHATECHGFPVSAEKAARPSSRIAALLPPRA